ncbi:MAG: ATP-dependent Clp protease adaptor ClpS [Fimbriimonadaceae bacterium]|nr:ATP-dependent Clp protease adaptor ClpS [Fimbriimonadaceae bacterium]
MERTVLEPKPGNPEAGASGRWMALIYNNDHNTFDQVIAAIVQATGCSPQEAAIEAWEAHHFGKAPVHFADRPECERVAATIATIGVRTEVQPEWRD